MLVRGLHDGAAYAMKVLRVDAIAKQRMAAEVQTERDVMVSFARQPHPFVVPLLRGYRSGSHCAPPASSNPRGLPRPPASA